MSTAYVSSKIKGKEQKNGILKLYNSPYNTYIRYNRYESKICAMTRKLQNCTAQLNNTQFMKYKGRPCNGIFEPCS